MNERIKELMKEANKDIPLGKPFWPALEEFSEKFAELIVRECIDVVKPTQHHEVWAQSYLGGVDGLDLLYSKIKDIKKHFGVEE
jgi:hypothetical protein